MCCQTTHKLECSGQSAATLTLTSPQTDIKEYQEYLIRPYWVVLLLLLLSLSFFDTFRMGGDHESYKGLIPPFLLENIIPGKAVFSPLSFIFWRGIIWTPEMWGKGGREVVPVF